MNYIVDSSSESAKVEFWSYQSYYAQDEGIIGVGSISETEAKSDLFISLPNGNYVSGSSVNCKINR